jgi:hypothetical protein
MVGSASLSPDTGRILSSARGECKAMGVASVLHGTRSVAGSRSVVCLSGMDAEMSVLGRVTPVGSRDPGCGATPAADRNMLGSRNAVGKRIALRHVHSQ